MEESCEMVLTPEDAQKHYRREVCTDVGGMMAFLLFIFITERVANFVASGNVFVFYSLIVLIGAFALGSVVFAVYLARDLLDYCKALSEQRIEAMYDVASQYGSLIQSPEKETDDE